MFGERSPLDAVFAQVVTKLSDDRKLVTRVERMVRKLIDNAIPDMAKLAAKKVVDRVVEEVGYNKIGRAYAEERLTVFLQSDEGKAMLDAQLAAAFAKFGEAQGFQAILHQFVGREFGQLAYQAVERAVKAHDRKKTRADKLLAKAKEAAK